MHRRPGVGLFSGERKCRLDARPKRRRGCPSLRARGSRSGQGSRRPPASRPLRRRCPIRRLIRPAPRTPPPLGLAAFHNVNYGNLGRARAAVASGSCLRPPRPTPGLRAAAAPTSPSPSGPSQLPGTLASPPCPPPGQRAFPRPAAPTPAPGLPAPARGAAARRRARALAPAPPNTSPRRRLRPRLHRPPDDGQLGRRLRRRAKLPNTTCGCLSRSPTQDIVIRLKTKEPQGAEE